MTPFHDMPTHVLNDLNVALLTAFVVGWTIFSVALALRAPRGRSRARRG